MYSNLRGFIHLCFKCISLIGIRFFFFFLWYISSMIFRGFYLCILKLLFVLLHNQTWTIDFVMIGLTTFITNHVLVVLILSFICFKGWYLLKFIKFLYECLRWFVMMYLLYHFSNKPISYSLEESSSLVLSSTSSTLSLEV